MANIWQYRGDGSSTGKQFPKAVLDAAEGSPLLARLLENRGIEEPADIQRFMNLDAYQPVSGWELPDMALAVERILAALETQESILIYGDFDVDGITGTSILYETLKKHLKANVSFYIPDRATEGHGLNTASLIRLTSSRKVKLIITTDTGITNFSEVSLLNGLGVDTIITDHHALPENLPPAVANINSQRLDESHSLCYLCGAGVAYKLCEILLEKRLSSVDAARAAEALLDIVALGTVVDMVPLLKENRYLVYQGLKVLNRRQRPGFVEILEQAGVKPDTVITSETLGFTIGPRLNALGRLERADQGVELITSTDAEQIRIIAAHLEFLNRKRRDLCDQTFLEAESHLQKNGGLSDKRAIILGSPSWNPGIVGIVASRLIEKYHVPVFMMVVDESKGEVRCSARSIPGFHLHDQLLALESYFLGFGGHAGAAGFALKLERLESFKRELHEICLKSITEEQMRPIIDVDVKLEWSQVNPYLLTLVDRLAPFGMQNPSPRFVLENVNVAAQRYMGEDERHIKLVLAKAGDPKSREPNTPLDGIIWNFGRKERFDARDPYHFVVVPSLNSFNGVTKVQLIIEDYLSPQSARLASENSQSAEQKRQTPATDRPATLASLKNHSGNPAVSLKSAAPGEPLIADDATMGPHWIDHRNRESVEIFVSQLMLPIQDKRSLLIYHEGKKPEIPFVDESLLSGRLNLRSADELIFWDLPPSMSDLENILESVKPQVIHWVGGKYQSVPVFSSEQNYLKLLMQILRKDGEQQTLELDSFASRLATTTDVVTHGLVLLERLDMLEVRLSEGSGKRSLPTALNPGTPVSLQVRLTPQKVGVQEDFSRRLEYFNFQQSLKAVGKFRGWLLKSPLDTIKTNFRSAGASSVSAAEVNASSSNPSSVSQRQANPVMST